MMADAQNRSLSGSHAETRRLLGFIAVMLVVVPTGAFLGGAFDSWAGASWRPGLDLAAFAAAPLATRIHLVAIVTLLAAGYGMLSLPKGNRRHRTLGWTWVGAMVAMGAASLAIPHGPSPLAGYLGGGSAMVLLAYAVFSIRRGDVAKHRRGMTIMMIALTFMLGVALLPGRLLHAVVFAG